MWSYHVYVLSSTAVRCDEVPVLAQFIPVLFLVSVPVPVLIPLLPTFFFLQAGLFMWIAGTVGAMAGTLVLPSRAGSFMMITEQVVNATLL